MKTQACNQCGKPVLRRQVTEVLGGGGHEVTLHAGERLGSMWMYHNDAEGRFCTMRCAATWAIQRTKARPA